ncbi:MAG: hypothetical protein HKO92_11790 [Flavobacteriaceae bacterium]|nr:hypothetical protein [Flavobacteriaceae bacterium]
MKTIRVLIIILFAFVLQNTFADAMPKGYQLYEFETTIEVDSLYVFESDNREELTKLDYTSDNRPWVTNCENNRCRAKASTYQKYQRIVVFVDGKPIMSSIYKPKGTNPTFKAQIQNDIVIVEETTSFIFKGKFGEILRALFLTLILELLVGIFFFGFKSNKALKTIFFINCITLPIAWLLFSYVNKIPGFSVLLTIIALEILVFVAEYFGYTKLLKGHSKKKLFVFTLTANLVSFFIGGLLFVITLFI